MQSESPSWHFHVKACVNVIFLHIHTETGKGKGSWLWRWNMWEYCGHQTPLHSFLFTNIKTSFIHIALHQMVLSSALVTHTHTHTQKRNGRCGWRKKRHANSRQMNTYVFWYIICIIMWQICLCVRERLCTVPVLVISHVVSHILLGSKSWYQLWKKFPWDHVAKLFSGLCIK